LTPRQADVLTQEKAMGKFKYCIDGHRELEIELDTDDIELAKLYLAEIPNTSPRDRRLEVIRMFHVLYGSLPKAIAIVDYAAKDMGYSNEQDGYYYV
jgi:hypothetical protein